MNFVHQRNATFSQAHLAERMLGGVSVPDPLPGAAVLPVHIGRACVSVVLAVYGFSVLFAVLSVSEPGASRPGAGPFRLRRHFPLLFLFSLAAYRRMYQHCSRYPTFLYGMGDTSCFSPPRVLSLLQPVRRCAMDKFIAYEKLSKKKKRELDAKRRGSWGGVNPVTRKPANPKAYSRAKARKWIHDDSSTVLSCICA